MLSTAHWLYHNKGKVHIIYIVKFNYYLVCTCPCQNDYILLPNKAIPLTTKGQQLPNQFATKTYSSLGNRQC